MARRFGGKYSPDPDDAANPAAPETRGPYDRAEVDPVGARANALFVPAVLLVFLSLNDGAVGLALGLVAAGVLGLAAWLLRGGLRAEAAYNARKVARRPALPRKALASALTGAGVAIAAYKTDPGLLAPMLYGAAATGLHVLAFGTDPLRDKGTEGVDRFQSGRVARVVDEAEAHLAAMQAAIARTGDRKLESRVDRFVATARDMCRTVEDDPRDLTAARKYLGVYLQGARDATVKFADIQARGGDARARADYLALLDDLDQNFAARTEKMLLTDRTDLTVEIDVLRERLQREGVKL
jgi:hypothetical protein